MSARQYLKYYQSYSSLAPWVFLKDALFERSNLRRRALLNRQADYLRLAGKPQLLALHARFHGRLAEAEASWPSYDYGEGYFYQSDGPLGITGLRDTEARATAMDLRRRVAGQRVLEIGCNTGFLTAILAETAKSVNAFDLNPHLVDIARLSAEHRGLRTCAFEVADGEQFQSGDRFDVVVSFANHATYDGNTTQPLSDYFKRCWELGNDDGQVLFESHAPAFEAGGLAVALTQLTRWFEVEHQQVVAVGTHLDRGRTFVVGRRRQRPAP